jgi:YD repeat-containing protein
MAAVISGNGLGLFNSSLQSNLGLGGDARLGVQGNDRHYVNVANGNLVLHSQDEQLLFRGMSLGQFRTYNSQGLSTQTGSDGWITGFERRVELLSGTVGAVGSVMRLHTGDGAYQDFTHAGGSTYQSTDGSGAHDTLNYAAGTKTWTYVEGSSRREETYADHANATLKGRLTRIRDLIGDAASPTSWDVLYDGPGRITQIRSKDTSAGATPDALVFSYDAAGRLATLSTRENGVVIGQVSYGYDSVGRLSSVLVDLTPQDGDGDSDTWDSANAAANDGRLYRTVYTYADATSLKISQVRQGDGSIVGYTYDTAGRVATVVTGDPQGAHATLTYSYNLASGQTDITDDGGRTWSYFHDAAGQLTEIHSPATDGQRTVSAYRYDVDGNVTQVQTRRGSQLLTQVDNQYDANGNLTWQWTALEPGTSALATAVQRTYTASNQLASETVYSGLDADGAGAVTAQGGATSTFVYDTQDRVRFIINAAGEVTERSYHASGTGIGQLANERRYLGATYAGTRSLAALQAWADGTQQASSGWVDYSYDLRGRLSQTRSFDGVSPDPESTEYVYDAQGLLREKAVIRYPEGREVAGNSIRQSTVYAYDGLGRLLSELVQERATFAGVPQAAQNLRSTTWLYQDSGSTVRTAIEAGVAGDGTANDLIRTELRNAAGQLVAVTESVVDGSSGSSRQTRQYYNASGQLSASEDANGGRTYHFYDAVGRLNAQVDATGAVVEFIRDGLGRVVSTVAYAERVTTTAWMSGGVVVPTLLSAIRPAATAGDRTTTATYDAAGRKLQEVDAEGGITTWAYDGAGRLLQVRSTDAAGNADTARSVRHLYDASGREVGVLDAAGYLTEYTYDAGGRRVSVIRYANATREQDRATGDLAALRPLPSEADATSRSFYDGRNALVGELDAEGYLTEYVYDHARNQRAVVAYALKLEGSALDGGFSSLLAAAKAGSARTTLRSYDALGQLVTEVSPEGAVTRLSYDAQGRLLHTRSDATGNDVRDGVRRYDAFGNLIGELSGEGAALYDEAMDASALDALFAEYGTRHVYNALGLRTETIDAEGNRTWYFHDSAGRVTQTIFGMADANGILNAEGEVEETRYSAFGQAQETLRYAGRIALQPPFGREQAETAVQVLQFVAAVDNRRQYLYDRLGRLIEQVDGEGYRTRLGYNAFGQVTLREEQVSSSSWNVTSYAYDQRGLMLSTTEDVGGLERQTTAQYDAFGRVVARQDGRGTVTHVQYDRAGRQVGVARSVVGRQETEQTFYDAYGRTVSTVDALGRVSTFAYDDTERTMTLTTPVGLQLVTRYNAHGEQVEVRRPDGYVREYFYDKEGRLISDGLRREDSFHDTYDERTQYFYDMRGNLVDTWDLTGAGTAYTYDARGRQLTRVDEGYTTDYSGNNIHDIAASWTYHYDGLGRRVSVTDGSGVQTVMSYDREGRLLESVVDPDGLALTTAYAWDGVGNQLSVTEAAGTADARTTMYAYDGLGRRTSETRAAGNLDLVSRYTYDGNDNVVARTDAAGRITRYAYDEAGRLLLQVDPTGGVAEQRFDVAGQLVSSRNYATAINLQGLALAAGEQEIRGRILADDARDHTSHFRYDPDGRRVLTVDAAGAVTQFIHDTQGNVIQTRTYAQGLALDPAQRAGLASGALDTLGILSAVSADDARDRVDSYLYDPSGRESYHIDSAGAVSATWYDAAGRVRSKAVLASPTTALPHAGIASGDVTLANIGEYLPSVERQTNRVDRLYDAAGRLVATLTWTESVDGESNWYSGGGANGARVQRYEYDGAGRIIATIDYGLSPQWYIPTRMAGAAMQEEQRLYWDSLPQLLDAIVANDRDYRPIDEVPQRITRYIHDSAGRERFQIGSAGNVQEFRYDAQGQRVATLSYGSTVENRQWTEAELAAHLAGVPDVRTTTQQYDAAGRVVASVDALGGVQRYAYDAAGQLVQYTDQNLAVWSYAYDAGGRRITETSPQVAISSVGSDGSISTSVRSVVIRSEYDVFGQVSRRIEDAGTPGARITEYEYDTRGNQVLTRFPDAGMLNGQGQLVATGVRPIVEVTYDVLGRAVMQKDVLGNYSYKSYDSAGQLQFEVDEEGLVTGYTYNTAGEQIELRRYVNGIATTPGTVLQSADIAGRLTPVVGGDRILATFYDSAGRKLQVAEVNYRQHSWDGSWDYYYGATTEFDYNIYGELVREAKLLEEPGNYVYRTGEYSSLDYTYTRWNQDAYFYDDAGRKTKRIDSEGYVTLWEYSARGEVIREVQLAEKEWYWNYDGSPGSYKEPTTLGQDRATEWSYDALGRRVSERQSRGNLADGEFVETLTEYDASGRATAVTAQGQRTQTFYNALGQVTAVLEAERDVVNGNADQQLASTGVGLGSASLYRRASPYSTMAYDAFGSVVQVRRYADGAEAGQAAVASARDQVHTTLYDWQGRNILERDVSGTVYTRTYDAADNLLTTRNRLDGSSGRWAVVTNEAIYDRAGRQLTSRVYRELYQGQGGAAVGVEGDTSSQVRYNAFGEIIAKDSRLDAGLATSAFAAQYVYDDNGRMTASNAEGGVWRYYSHDLAGNVIAERHAVTNSAGVEVQVETRMELDHRGKLLRQYAAGNSDLDNDYAMTEWSYDAWGNVLTQTDALGNMTYYEYNQLNQVTRELKPTVRVLNANGSVSELAPELQWEYDALGRLTGSRDANGNWKRSGFDASGRQVYSDDALGKRTTTAYDVFGQKRFTQDPLGYVTFLEYDPAGRVVAQGDFLTEADGQSRSKATRERYGLDQNGNRLRVTDALGYVNTYDYDSRGLVIRSLTAAGVAMSYGYDSQGNKIRETNALSDPSLAADGIPVFNGGIVASQYGLVGQAISVGIPPGAFSTADGEQPAISVRVLYSTSNTVAVEASGFSYDPQTRTVTGVVAQTGNYEIVFTATSSSGKTATATAHVTSVGQAAYDNFYSNAPKANVGLFNQRVSPGQPFSYQIPADAFIAAPGQGISYQAYVVKSVSTYDPELRRTFTDRIQVAIGSAEDDSGLTFDPATGTLSGSMGSVGTREVIIRATGANNRSTSQTLLIESRQPTGRRTVTDSEGELLYLDEMTWDYDYFGRLRDHNDLSGADYDYTYDEITGQLRGENSKWTEEGRSYSTPVADYWYDRDWQQYGMDSDLVEYDLPEPELLNDPKREYSYYRSGALKELKEGNNRFQYEYDANGNRTLEEAFTYDADGTLLHVLTRVTYDAHGRITKVTQRDLANGRNLLELNYDYDAAGNRRRVLAASAYDATAPGLDITGITNPDFEAGDMGWVLGQGWSVVAGGEGNSTLRAQYSFTGQSTILNKQRVEVRPGERIIASVRVDQGASSAGEAGAVVFIQWYDHAGNPLSTSEGNMVDSASGGDIYDSRVAEWVPSEAAFMSIGVRAFRDGGGDPLFIDNFTWGVSLSNGDFSEGEDGWAFEQGAGWSSDYNGSLQFNQDAETRAVNYDQVPVQAGRMVNARANVQQGASSQGTAWGAVFLRFYDAQGNVIADVEGNRVDDGAGGAWHSSYVNTRVPQGAVSMSVGGVAGRTGGHALWMDDFSWNYEREGELEPLGDYIDPDPSHPYNIPGKKAYWYEYDANNRVTVANGKLSNGQIVLGSADISYALDYDDAGRATRRRFMSGHVEVAETTQYDERGQRLRVFQSVGLGDTSPMSLKDAYTYDAVGRVIEQRTYFDNGATRNGVNISGWLKHAETFSYDADGRILQQVVLGRELDWATGQQSDGGAFQTTNLRSLQYLSTVNYTGYDAAGRLRGYGYQHLQHEDGMGAAASDPKGYRHTYIYSYEARDSYLEARVQGTSTNQNFRASSTYSTYDAWGRRVAVRENTPLSSNLGTLDDRIRYFSYDGTGNILQRREGTLKNGAFNQDALQATQNQLYAYVNGQLVGSGKRNGEVDVVGRLTAYQSNNAAGSSRTTVQAGETLRGIAQRVYGNANLWYVLAEANAINDDSSLTAGTTLVVPEVKVTANDATTFKPFSPQEAIGNTSPSLPYIEPPPKEHCNGIAMVLMVVVAVVAAVFTAGAALTAIAALAPSLGIVTGTTLMATGFAALTGGVVATGTALGVGAAVAGAAFAGGMAGSIASQAVGKSLGVVDSFSLRSAVASGIGSMFTAGVGGAGNVAEVAAAGAASVVGAYAGGKIAGVPDTHFSWRAVAASAVSAVVSAPISRAVGSTFPNSTVGSIANRTMQGMAGGVVSLHTGRQFGLDGDINYGAIAADSFGNALGSAFVAKFAGVRQPSTRAVGQGAAGTVFDPGYQAPWLYDQDGAAQRDTPGVQEILSRIADEQLSDDGRSFSERYPFALAAGYGDRSDSRLPDVASAERDRINRATGFTRIASDESIFMMLDEIDQARAAGKDVSNSEDLLIELWGRTYAGDSVDSGGGGALSLGPVDSDSQVTPYAADLLQSSASAPLWQMAGVPASPPSWETPTVTWQASGEKFGESFYKDWNTIAESNPALSEFIGVQSSPGTLRDLAEESVAAVSAGYGTVRATSATGVRTQVSAYVKPNVRMINTIVVNPNAAANQPMVTSIMSYGKVAPIPVSSYMRAGLVEGAKKAPLLAFVGTALQYGLANHYDKGVNLGGDTWRDFTVDATLDVSKSLVAGAAGAAVGSAVTGALVGSVVPGVGTAIGFGVGMAVGIVTSVVIEQGFTWAGSRDALKGR